MMGIGHGQDPTAMPSANSEDPSTAAYVRFMAAEVKPKMAELLNLPEYDPTTGQGFGCFNCHAMVSADPAP